MRFQINKELTIKLGQVVGALFMIAGVASCQMGAIEKTPMLMLLGGLIYGGFRMAAWLAPSK